MISFCIPAHNEERLIPATLAAIGAAARELALDYEVVVADDASTDATREAACAAGARVVRIDRRQISAARNAAARAARGDVLIFVDADTRVHAAAVAQALRLLAAGCVGGGAIPRFEGRVPVWATVMVWCFLGPYRLAGFAAGAFMFCRREAFERSGGFDEALFAGEEVDFALRLRRLGRFRLIRERVVTSGRKLRTYSLAEVLATLWRAVRRGRRSVSTRDGLELWYGPRRADPADRAKARE